MIKKCLIANRGEIAVRIIRSCKDLNIATVAIYSTADKDALHVQLADESVCVGGPQSKDSYLHMHNIIEAAILTGCDAIHPGFGFLSENPMFASLVSQCGLIFIGPSSDVIELMGNKINARKRMIEAGVQVIPGSIGAVKDEVEAVSIANTIGYPVMIKAAAGGGGRGIRMVNSQEELMKVFSPLKQEAKNNFSDDTVYIEKLFTKAKHIEVQILADKHGTVLHLYERDCSFQRRHQKVIEEAPCHLLSSEQREKICAEAIKVAKAVSYDSVGTVEFLMDERFEAYFMEMNTRIQVEHPITEMVTGVDLIRHQIRSAEGCKLTLKQEDIVIKGHAIECRINAEDMRRGFAPTPGTITFIHTPGGKDVRIDSAIYQGYTISPYYDSMIAKLITFGDSRLQAIKRMRGALEEFIIDGVASNVEFHYLTMHHAQFIDGRYTTDFAGKWIQELSEREPII